MKTDISYYINKSAYVHTLNKTKDFGLTVKIFGGSSSVLSELIEYIYHFYEGT